MSGDSALKQYNHILLIYAYMLTQSRIQMQNRITLFRVPGRMPRPHFASTRITSTRACTCGHMQGAQVGEDTQVTREGSGRGTLRARTVQELSVRLIGRRKRLHLVLGEECCELPIIMYMLPGSRGHSCHRPSIFRARRRYHRIMMRH